MSSRATAEMLRRIFTEKCRELGDSLRAKGYTEETLGVPSADFIVLRALDKNRVAIVHAQKFLSALFTSRGSSHFSQRLLENIVDVKYAGEISDAQIADHGFCTSMVDAGFKRWWKRDGNPPCTAGDLRDNPMHFDVLPGLLEALEKFVEAMPPVPRGDVQSGSQRKNNEKESNSSWYVGCAAFTKNKLDFFPSAQRMSVFVDSAGGVPGTGNILAVPVSGTDLVGLANCVVTERPPVQNDAAITPRLNAALLESFGERALSIAARRDEVKDLQAFIESAFKLKGHAKSATAISQLCTKLSQHSVEPPKTLRGKVALPGSDLVLHWVARNIFTKGLSVKYFMESPETLNFLERFSRNLNEMALSYSGDDIRASLDRAIEMATADLNFGDDLLSDVADVHRLDGSLSRIATALLVERYGLDSCGFLSPGKNAAAADEIAGAIAGSILEELRAFAQKAGVEVKAAPSVDDAKAKASAYNKVMADASKLVARRIGRVSDNVQGIFRSSRKCAWGEIELSLRCIYSDTGEITKYSFAVSSEAQTPSLRSAYLKVPSYIDFKTLAKRADLVAFLNAVKKEDLLWIQSEANAIIDRFTVRGEQLENAVERFKERFPAECMTYYLGTTSGIGM